MRLLGRVEERVIKSLRGGEEEGDEERERRDEKSDKQVKGWEGQVG